LRLVRVSLSAKVASNFHKIVTPVAVGPRFPIG